MTGVDFERARTPEAKRARQDAILAAAARLATANGVREVTASAVADEVGMHKSAMLRYFETREDIFLRLAAEAWGEWSTAVRAELEALDAGPAAAVGRHEQDDAAHAAAAVLAHSLVSRPLFCDLLAHTPLNLERNVSFERVKAFKTRAIAAVAEIAATLCTVTPLRLDQARSVVATATSMAGAMWQMAAPSTNLRAFYESEPELAHAVVDVEPSLTDIISALITGYAARSTWPASN
ncbi:TetR family transcriptional regulator [Catenulispora rubra]|uniref:TetR family transcriptional regulator n=1 Tax=Catenulispora rubra TaxID=280293 RepID=UPI0018922419|nr:TetR family transcriptional regulator [Catenulispora rubra]